MLSQTWYRDNYVISSDKTKLDPKVIHQFLTDSYWAKGRTFEEVVGSIDKSVCLGLYDGNKQIGFARVVTDYVLFAYLFDVFVLPSYQGIGLGKWLIDTLFKVEELKAINTWMLGTKDAQKLYEKFQFKQHEYPDRVMMRKTNSETM